VFPHGKKVRSQAQCTVTVRNLILPEFPMSCLTSAIKPLRVANEIGDLAGRLFNLA
jgi:transcriptional regulator GlxA family with amidase domain